MNCEETERLFSSYLDGALNASATALADAHLRECPNCRARLEATRAVVRGLALLERPAAPHRLAASITDALAIERAARAAKPAPPVYARIFDWIEPRVMPYTVGALASLILFVTVLSAVRPYVERFRDIAEAERMESCAWIDQTGGGDDVTKPHTPENIAAPRISVGPQSPSINPRGALAALAWSPPTGQPGDDDMIVVADVYGNGRASLAAVVEPPRNPHMLDELEDALRKNAAFVPATLDRRPQTLRVVFVLQKMNIQDESY
jgi:anti-sigma factor RsiW